MIKWKKYICVALSAAMMSSLLAGCGDTSKKDASEDKEQAVTEASASDTLQDALTSQISADDADDADKEETVYVLADANGNANDVTVSTWLKNADGAEGLNDKTNLTDIENVKGYEGYKDNGDGTITWAANGSDIYYQGKSSEKLPVDVRITYKLGGKEVEPSELAGKSGKVTIRFDYTNNTRKTVKVAGKNNEVISPFVMLSGVILPVDKFSNVQVKNGKVISEGSNQIVVGYAVPGFKECLQEGIDDTKIQTAIDNIDVPDYVEVSADVTDFELAMTMTVAASDLLNSDAGDAIEEVKDKANVNELSDSAEQLGSSADQLEEGSGRITNGLETLKDGTYSLATGAATLADGAASLETYTSQLADGTSKISTAIGSLDEGIKSIQTGSAALNEGAQTLATGAATVDAGVQEVYDGETALKTGVDTLLAGYESTDEAQGAVDAAKSLATGVKQIYTSSGTLAKSTKTLSDGATQVSDGVSTLISTMQSMPATVVDQATSAVYSQLSAYGITDEAGLQAAIDKMAGALAAGPDAVGGAEAYKGMLAQYTALAQAQGSLSAISSIGSNLTATLTSEEMTAQTTALTDGATAVADGASALNTGAGELKEALKTASTGASALSTGVGKLYKGTKSVSTGVSSLIKGTKTLKKGSKSLSDGAATISTNMNTLYQGSVTLASGSGELLTAANTLDTSAGQIAEGAKSLSSGAAELNEGSKTLDSGAEDLVSGSKTLSDGMKQFNEDGIKKITKLFAGNYQDDIDYIEALFSDDAKYTSFGGTLDGTTSTVKFIYETGAIKTESGK